MRLLIQRALSCCISLAALAPAGVLLTPTAAVARPARPTSVAVIDLNRVLDQLDEKTAREKQLETFLKALEDGVNNLAKQLKSAKEELEILPKNGAAFLAKREEVLRLTARVQGEAQAAKILAEDKKKTMQIDLFEKIGDATRDFAKKNGWDIVMIDDSKEKIPSEASPQQAQAAMVNRRLLFASIDVDISEQVAQQMNNDFKAGGADKPADAPAAKPAEKKPN